MAAIDTFLAGLPAEVAYLFADATVLSTLMALVKARRRKDPRRSQAEIASEVVNELLVPGSPFRGMLDTVMEKKKRSGEAEATAQMTAELGAFESTNGGNLEEPTSRSSNMGTRNMNNISEQPLASNDNVQHTAQCEPPMPPPPPSPKLGSRAVAPSVNHPSGFRYNPNSQSEARQLQYHSSQLIQFK